MNKHEINRIKFRSQWIPIAPVIDPASLSLGWSHLNGEHASIFEASAYKSSTLSGWLMKFIALRAENHHNGRHKKDNEDG